MAPCFFIDKKYKVYFSSRCFLISSDTTYFPFQHSKTDVLETPLIAIGVMGRYYGSYNPLRASLTHLTKQNGYAGLLDCVERYIREWKGDVPIAVRDCKVIGRLRGKGEAMRTSSTSASVAIPRVTKRAAEEQLPRQYKRMKIRRNAKVVRGIRRGKSAERRRKSGDRDARIRRRNLVGKIAERRSGENGLPTSEASPTRSTSIPPTSSVSDSPLSRTQLPNATTLESVFSFSFPSPSTSPTPAQETPPKIPSLAFIDLTTKVLS